MAGRLTYHDTGGWSGGDPGEPWDAQIDPARQACTFPMKLRQIHGHSWYDLTADRLDETAEQDAGDVVELVGYDVERVRWHSPRPKPVEIIHYRLAIKQDRSIDVVLSLQKFDHDLCSRQAQRGLFAVLRPMVDIEGSASQRSNRGQAVDDVTEFSAMPKGIQSSSDALCAGSSADLAAGG